MSSVQQWLCCIPVLALWFAPLALVVFCGVFDGCARIARLARRAPCLQASVAR